MFDALTTSTLTDNPLTGIATVLVILLIGIGSLAILSSIVSWVRQRRAKDMTLHDEWKNVDPFKRW